MGLPKNDAMYKAIKKRADELTSLFVVGDEPIARTIARELAALQPERSQSSAYQMVCYYLRGGNKREGAKDSRRTYTAKELANLELMSTAERASYAVHTGRSTRAIDAALARFRKADTAYAELPHSKDITTEVILSDNYYNFSSALHLKLRNRTRAQLAAARTFLTHPYGLSLRAPNILYHAKTKRRFYLRAAHQDAILENPKRFLTTCAGLLKDGWITSEFDPIADDCLKVAEEDRSFTSVHKHDRRRDIKEAIKIFSRGQELLEKIIRSAGIQEGLPLHTTLKVTKIWLDRALETALTKDSYVDRVETTTIPAQGLNTTEEKLKLSEQDEEEKLKLSEQDEDESWMTEFKSVGAPDVNEVCND